MRDMLGGARRKRAAPVPETSPGKN